MHQYTIGFSDYSLHSLLDALDYIFSSGDLTKDIWLSELDPSGSMCQGPIPRNICILATYR